MTCALIGTKASAAQAPHAVDAMLSLALRLRDGVEFHALHALHALLLGQLLLM